MKPHTRHRRTAAAATIALVGALSLSGCGQVDPRAAATADGRVVSEQDVEAVLADFRRASVPDEQIPERADIANNLVVGPVFFGHLQGTGVVPGTSIVRRSLERELPDVSASTVEFIRLKQIPSGLQALQQQAGSDPRARAQLKQVDAAVQKAQAEITQKVESGAIVLNPRYAGHQGVPNWIEQTATTNEGMPGGAPQEAPPAPNQPPAPQG